MTSPMDNLIYDQRGHYCQVLYIFYKGVLQGNGRNVGDGEAMVQSDLLVTHNFFCTQLIQQTTAALDT